jgi:hypothetical protein
MTFKLHGALRQTLDLSRGAHELELTAIQRQVSGASRWKPRFHQTPNAPACWPRSTLSS